MGTSGGRPAGIGTWASSGPAGEGLAFELNDGCGVPAAEPPGIRHPDAPTRMTMRRSAAADRGVIFMSSTRWAHHSTRCSAGQLAVAHDRTSPQKDIPDSKTEVRAVEGTAALS